MWRRWRVLSASLALLLAFAGGCASRGGGVFLDTAEREEGWRHSFSQAYITPGRAGEYDIVLVDSAAEWDYRKAKPGKPLKPTPLAPIRHVMHIHLHWRPLAGTSKNPAAINASIDWHVLGPDGSNGRVIYGGAGYVTVRGSGSHREITIRDGQIKPKMSQGELGDPIGPANISGQVTALVSEMRVREILSQIQQEAELARQ